jgi:hypothetical protein
VNWQASDYYGGRKPFSALRDMLAAEKDPGLHAIAEIAVHSLPGMDRINPDYIRKTLPVNRLRSNCGIVDDFHTPCGVAARQ